MSEHVKRLWPELLDMEDTLQRLTESPHVVATTAAPADTFDPDNPEHVDRLLTALRKMRRGGPLGID